MQTQLSVELNFAAGATSQSMPLNPCFRMVEMDSSSFSFYFFSWSPLTYSAHSHLHGVREKSTQISQFNYFESLLGTTWEDEGVASNEFSKS